MMMIFRFMFTGWDIEICSDGRIRVSKNEYSKSNEAVTNIGKGGRTEKLNHAEMKEYRKFAGKLSWLAQGNHPDLNYTMLAMSK